MLAASLYIAWCSAKNRAMVRLRRLREPRYLIGAIAGIAYFYSVFARSFGPAFQVAGTSIAGLFVMCFALLPWVLPSRSKLLQFSQSEREFLFTAPVSRRQLLVHRIVRSQVGSIIASVFI